MPNALKYHFTPDEAIEKLYQKGFMDGANAGFLQQLIDATIEIDENQFFWQEHFRVEGNEYDIDRSDLKKNPAWSVKQITKRSVPMADAMAPLSETLQLEGEGANQFFGEPAFDIHDLMQTEGGKGIMNVLAADKLMQQPKLYSTFLLWLLSELYSTLPEVGDNDLPKLVFFFDEAHMLFDGTSKALVDKIEQVIRLIRSKGVGIYFITQSPTDLPENILGQLGNRVQHALRAYTPKDQKAVKTAAETFRSNPDFNTYDAITNLETGEALVSFLDEKGAPQIVERAKILFPLSQIGAITEGQRLDIVKGSDIYGKYDEAVDRESALEVLLAESEQQAIVVQEQAELQKKEEEEKALQKKKGKEKPSFFSKVIKAVFTAITATLATILGNIAAEKVTGKKTRKSSTSTTGRVVKNATSAATRTITREITRDILGNLVK